MVEFLQRERKQKVGLAELLETRGRRNLRYLIQTKDARHKKQDMSKVYGLIKTEKLKPLNRNWIAMASYSAFGMLADRCETK